MKLTLFALGLALVLMLAIASAARAAEGTPPAIGAADFLPTAAHSSGFRGDGSGCWPGAKTPAMHWDEGLWESTDTGILWRTPMPKVSLSSPVVVGDKVFTLADPHTLLCVDARRGKILWRKDNPPFDAMPPEKAQRARTLLGQAAPVIHTWYQLLREYYWLNARAPNGAGAAWSEWISKAAPPSHLLSDDPAIPARLKELEAWWSENKFSNVPWNDGSTLAVNPMNTGHGYAIYNPNTPEYTTFYGGLLRELFLDYGISLLADQTGMQPWNYGETQQTPVSDGKFVYAAFGYGQTVCYDLQGNRKWMSWFPPYFNVETKAGFGTGHGLWFDHLYYQYQFFGESPLLYGDKLITSNGGAVRALNKLTGKLIWEQPYADLNVGAWGTPQVMALANGQYVLFCPQGLILNPDDGSILASSGNDQWAFFGLEVGDWHSVLVGHPVVHGDKIFATWAFGLVAYQVIPNGAGKVALKKLWLATQPPQRNDDDDVMAKQMKQYLTEEPHSKSPETLYTTSPVFDAARNRVYVGTTLCLRVYAFNADTGALEGTYKVKGTNTGMSSWGASATIVGGRYLYFPRAAGDVTVFDLDQLGVPQIANNHIFNAYMRDWNSNRNGYAKDSTLHRAPYEVMLHRWFADDWSRPFDDFWSNQNGLQLYGDLAFSGDCVFLRSLDALYCLKTGAKDTQAPTTPTGLNATLSPRTDKHLVQLRWKESTDNVRVAAYHILVNGTEKQCLAYPLAEFGAKPGEQIKFTVIAEDGSGNRSKPSKMLRFTAP